MSKTEVSLPENEETPNTDVKSAIIKATAMVAVTAAVIGTATYLQRKLAKDDD